MENNIYKIATKLNFPVGSIGEIITIYNQSYRHYHNINHINKCLELLQETDKVENPVYELAFIFHDVIYTPGAKDNEERSAEFAYRFITERMFEPAFVADAVKNLIVTPSDLFNSIDYHYFSCDWDEYNEKYRKPLYKEFRSFMNSGYAKFSFAKFLIGRQEFLWNLHLPKGHNNIEKELKMLKDGDWQ